MGSLIYSLYFAEQGVVCVMNKIYKVIYSRVKNCCVVVSELARSAAGGSARQKVRAELAQKVLAGLALGTMFALPALGYAMPQAMDGQRMDATISTGAKTMDITGTEGNGKNVLNWETFNVAADETVNFNGAQSYLNLIHDNLASHIDGKLTGAGSNVYLINPNGVIFGADSVVNLGSGSLYASASKLHGSAWDEYVDGSGALKAVDSANVTGDIACLGDLAANNVYLEGNIVTLTNDIGTIHADVRADNVNFAYATDAEPVTEINGTQYTEADQGKLDNELTTFKDKIGNTITLNHLNSDPFTKAETDSIDGYFLVRNAYELQNMQNNPDEQYLLGRDIDLSVTEGWNGGTGFAPILGNDASNYAFTGVFDGNGFKIKNIHIDLPDGEGVGLFGFAQNATLKNVVLEGGSVAGYSNVGALVGSAAVGTIVEGTVTGVSVTGSGSENIGGLVGSAEASKVVGSIHNASVKGEDNVYDIGGLVGTATGNSVIIGFTGEGTAISAAPQDGGAGGLVGYAEDATVKGYNQGTVSLTEGGSGGSFGGLVGCVGGTTTISGFNLGAVGSVDATNAGGIVGMVDSTADSTILGYNLGKAGGGTTQGKLIGTVAENAKATVKGNSKNLEEASGTPAQGAIEFTSWDDVDESAFKSLAGGTDGIYGVNKLNWTRPNPTDITDREIDLLDIAGSPNPATTWYIDNEKTYPLLNDYFLSSDENSYTLLEKPIEDSTQYTYTALKQELKQPDKLKEQLDTALAKLNKEIGLNLHYSGDLYVDAEKSDHAEFKDAGNYAITTTWLAPYKFNTKEAIITATIAPRKVKIKLVSPDALNREYNGSSFTTDGVGNYYDLVGVVDGEESLVSLGDIYGTYRNNAGNSDANAGDKTVVFDGISLTGAGASNYRLSDIDKTQTVSGIKIAPLKLDLTLKDNAKIQKYYDGKADTAQSLGELFAIGTANWNGLTKETQEWIASFLGTYLNANGEADGSVGMHKPVAFNLGGNYDVTFYGVAGGIFGDIVDPRPISIVDPRPIDISIGSLLANDGETVSQKDRWWLEGRLLQAAQKPSKKQFTIEVESMKGLPTTDIYDDGIEHHEQDSND